MLRRVLLGLAIVFALLPSPALAQEDTPSLGFTLSPSSGPPGTKVHFEGDVPVDDIDFDSFAKDGFAYGLEGGGPDDCELIIELEEVHKTVTPDGHFTGSFVVGSTGGCFMSPTDLGPQVARPGLYYVLLGCHACTPAGTFTITSPPLARTGSSTPFLAGVGIALLGLGTLLRSGVRMRS